MDVVVRNLHYTYLAGAEALRGISLVLHGGERVALVGENGSGKTTLVKHLNGLLRPTAGEVRIGDWDTRTHTTAQLARRVGFLFQNPDEQIFKNRVADEVAFGPRQLGFGADEVTARVQAALDKTGLAGLADAHPYELLWTQRKWLALASVLAMDPPILVLDEPTAGQDARGLERLGALVEALASHGKLIIVVTHDLDFAAERCERLIALTRGVVLLDGEVHLTLSEAERLAEAHLEPPQMTQLGQALGLRPAVTVEEFLEALSEQAH